MHRGSGWKNPLSRIGSLCTGIFVVVLVWKVGPARLAAAFDSAVPHLLFAGGATALAGWILVAVKWQAILRTLSEQQPLSRLLGLTLASQLWGLLLPIPFSDEVYRSGQLVGREVPLSTMAKAAAVDRLSTLVGTALVGFVAAILQHGTSFDDRLVAPLAAVAAAPLLGYALLRHRAATGLILAPARRVLTRGRVAELEAVIVWLLTRPRTLALFIALAVTVQLVFVFAMTAWAHGVGVPLTVVQTAWAMMVAALLPYLLPVPGMAVLVQQGAFVYLLVNLGISTERAGALALSSLALLVLFGAAGAAWEGGEALMSRGRVSTRGCTPDDKGVTG